MIQSMTGFGVGSFRAGENSFEVEVRSVNHRHLDARVRVPRNLSALEPELRARIQARFERGKFDCTLAVPEGAAPPQHLFVDRDAVREYLRAAREIAAACRVQGELRIPELLALPGVARFAEDEVAVGEVRDAALRGLDQALDALAAMRAAEGGALERDLRERLARIDAIADALAQRADVVQEAVRERLRRRAKQLEAETGLLDEARLHQEVTLAADRLDVSEEIVRLRSHTDQFRETLDGAGPGRAVGRRLEFLLQELSREANTIGSKGGDTEVAHAVVDLKTELEKVREQVQNVE